MDERYFHLLEYYIKGLTPWEQQKIFDMVSNQLYDFQIETIFDECNGFKNIFAHTAFDTEEKVRHLLRNVTPLADAVNEKMIEFERYPLYEDTGNLLAVAKKYQYLNQFLPESECNKIMGCESFESYIPPKYNDQTKKEL